MAEEARANSLKPPMKYSDEELLEMRQRAQQTGETLPASVVLAINRLAFRLDSEKAAFERTVELADAQPLSVFGLIADAHPATDDDAPQLTIDPNHLSLVRRPTRAPSNAKKTYLLKFIRERFCPEATGVRPGFEAVFACKAKNPLQPLDETLESDYTTISNCKDPEPYDNGNPDNGLFYPITATLDGTEYKFDQVNALMCAIYLLKKTTVQAILALEPDLRDPDNDVLLFTLVLAMSPDHKGTFCKILKCLIPYHKKHRYEVSEQLKDIITKAQAFFKPGTNEDGTKSGNARTFAVLEAFVSFTTRTRAASKAIVNALPLKETRDFFDLFI